MAWVYLGIIIVFFVASIAFTELLERLRRM